MEHHCSFSASPRHRGTDCTFPWASLRGGRPSAALRPAPPSAWPLGPALPTDTRPGPPRPGPAHSQEEAHPRSPEGPWPPPRQTRYRRGHREAEDGPRLKRAAEASRPGFGTGFQPPRTSTDRRLLWAASYTSRAEMRNQQDLARPGCFPSR